ncbi:MAG: hypothetical protein RRA34_04925 [Candidatus Calditenuis sp.]|nr:hypothetical protein [Candidatus Calditenuis sp.]
MEVEGLIERTIEEIFRNREEVYSASKAFLKDGLRAEEYLPELERFWRTQLEALDRFYSEVKKLNPIEMAKMVNRVRADPRLANLYHIAKRVGRKLSEVDRRLGEWAAMVLEERLKEAGEPPVPIAPRRAPEVVVREPPARPADAIEVAEIRPEAAAVPEPPVPEPRAQPLVVPEPTTGNAPTIAHQPEAPKEKPPVAPQVPVRREIDRAAIAAAVERAVVKARKRSPMEVYYDLYELLSRALIGPEQPLVSLCWLIMSYLLGETNYEELTELSQDYIAALKSAENMVFRPEIRRLAVEVVAHAEEKTELRPFASFVQLCLGAQEVKEAWHRSPSS